MKLNQYNFLNEDQKYEVLIEYGALVAHRSKPGEKIILYQLFSFYVELYFSTTKIEIYQLKVFSNTNRLTEYIKHINLNEINLIIQKSKE